MANEGQVTVAAELESTKNALQTALKELEAARHRENKLLDTIKGQANALSETSGRPPARRRSADYLMLLAVVALAGWQVYLTVQLQRLLN